jgi:tetratricopeptide (TPR) repeat protein
VGKFALLIGVGDYRSAEFADLAAAVPDVNAMQTVLQDPSVGGFAIADVTTLLNPEPQQMREALERLFSERKSDDLLVLYFSGHGVVDDAGRFHLTTAHTQKGMLNSTAIAGSFIHGLMENSRSKQQVVILDCCFSGAFAKGMMAKGDAVNFQAQLGGKGRAVLTSSSATEYSFEQKEAELSVYTQYVVEGLRTGIADKGGDGWISVDELHEFAGAKVRETSPAMKPKIYAVEEGYKIILAKAPMGNPELEYRKAVEQLAVERQGKLSATILMALEVRQRQWGLDSALALAIRQEVLRPYEEFTAKLQQYQQALQQDLRSGNQLSVETWEDLKYFQQTLGLTDENIEIFVKDITIESIASKTQVSESSRAPTVNSFQPLEPRTFSGSFTAQLKRRVAIVKDNDSNKKQKIKWWLLVVIFVGPFLIYKLSPSPTVTTSSQSSPTVTSSPQPSPKAEENQKPFIGIQMTSLTPELAQQIRKQPNIKLNLSVDDGVLVNKVLENSPALISGILVGDIIQKVNGKTVKTSEEVSLSISMSGVGVEIPFEIDRAGKTITLKVKTQIMPAYVALGYRGLEKFEKKDFKGAIEDYDQAIKLKPDYTDAYINRGDARGKLGDDKGAIADYDQAIKLKPDFTYAYINRGNARGNLGDNKGAIADYDQAIKLKPDDETAYHNRGLTRGKLGDDKGAIADYDQAIKLKPDYTDAYINRGVTRGKLGDDKGAITDYDQAIKLKPDYANAYYNRGVTRGKLGDDKGAIADYDQAIKLKPDYTDAYYNRGITRGKLGDDKGAIADYDQAIKLKPDYTYAYHNRGTARGKLGDKKDAIADYKKAVELYPSDNPFRQSALDEIKKLQE